MKKVVLAAVLLSAASAATVSAAERNCYSPGDIEAEQALLFQTAGVLAFAMVVLFMEKFRFA